LDGKVMVADGCDLVVGKGLEVPALDGQDMQVGGDEVVWNGSGVCKGLGLLPWKMDGGKLAKGRVPLGEGIWWVQLYLKWAGLGGWGNTRDELYGVGRLVWMVGGGGGGPNIEVLAGVWLVGV